MRKASSIVWKQIGQRKSLSTFALARTADSYFSSSDGTEPDPCWGSFFTSPPIEGTYVPPDDPSILLPPLLLRANSLTTKVDGAQTNTLKSCRVSTCWFWECPPPWHHQAPESRVDDFESPTNRNWTLITFAYEILKRHTLVRWRIPFQLLARTILLISSLLTK